MTEAPNYLTAVQRRIAIAGKDETGRLTKAQISSPDSAGFGKIAGEHNLAASVPIVRLPDLFHSETRFRTAS